MSFLVLFLYLFLFVCVRVSVCALVCIFQSQKIVLTWKETQTLFFHVFTGEKIWYVQTADTSKALGRVYIFFQIPILLLGLSPQISQLYRLFGQSIIMELFHKWKYLHRKEKILFVEKKSKEWLITISKFFMMLKF